MIATGAMRRLLPVNPIWGILLAPIGHLANGIDLYNPILYAFKVVGTLYQA
jgi:hypothetical protein